MTDAGATDPRFSAALRGFGPLGLVAILAIVAGAMLGPVVSAVMILIWVWLSKTPWPEIGYARPRSWAGGAILGIALGVAFKFAMKAVVMPLLGAPPINAAYHYLAGNPQEAAIAAVQIVFLVGWAEETVFRGYLFERLGKLLGRGFGATLLIVLFVSALFGMAHYMGQGWPGVEQAAVVGLVLGTIYAFTRKLWMLIWLHTAFDLTAVAMIYLDAENQIAHLVFT